VTMGGGPSQWAAQAHIQAGLPLYATPLAARSFNDDLEAVKAMGIQIIGEDDATRLASSVLQIELRDFDFPAIARAYEQFGVSLRDLSAVAVAVFDHGNAPPNYSDRQFRFDYLDQRIRAANRLSAFAYPSAKIPPSMTRLQAVVDSAADVDSLLIVMDTAPAAILGATCDPWVASQPRVMIVNVGNFHTLAFRLGKGEGDSHHIEGVFEHHTGLLDLPKLERLLNALADGRLSHAEVFNQHGHGALVYDPTPLPLEGDFNVVVTGPRRGIFRTAASKNTQSLIRPYFAVPFGDMMAAGCFGLLTATADLIPDLRKPILISLKEGGNGSTPWDIA